MRFGKLVLWMCLMIAFASGTFAIVVEWEDLHKTGLIDFPQAAAISCFVAALIPLLLFMRSQKFADRVLTLVQIVLLTLTAAAGGLSPYFEKKGPLLFTIWFACGVVGVTIAVKMLSRIMKNGEQPTTDEIEQYQTRYAHCLHLEAYFLEEAKLVTMQVPMDVNRMIALKEMSEHLRTERMTLEAYLRKVDTIRPLPVFVEEVDPTSVANDTSDVASRLN